MSYLKLGKRAKQRDPIFAYLFILVSEIIFIMVKSNQNTQPINIFDHDFLYIA